MTPTSSLIIVDAIESNSELNQNTSQLYLKPYFYKISCLYTIFNLEVILNFWQFPSCTDVYNSDRSYRGLILSESNWSPQWFFTIERQNSVPRQFIMRPVVNEKSPLSILQGKLNEYLHVKYRYRYSQIQPQKSISHHIFYFDIMICHTKT